MNVPRVRPRTPSAMRDGFDFFPAEEDAPVFQRVRRGGELVATDPSRAQADCVRLCVWKRRSRYGRSKAPSEATLRELKGLGYAGDGE